MNARVWLTAITVVASSAALAGEEYECVLNADALKPQVDKKLPAGWKLVKAERVDRVHREVFTLPDGFELTVQISGCAHLGLTFSLKSKKAITPQLKPAEGVALLKKYSEATPFLKDAHFGQPIMKDAFAALTTVPEKFPVPVQCGKYETCELLLETKGKDTTLSFAYDFPL